nr:GTPase [Natrarchaeobaculum aegyptiacum]
MTGRDRNTTGAEPERDRVVLIGKESVGKSALAAGLTGAAATDRNVQGTTVSSEVYRTDDLEVVDTPGITLEADTETTRRALAALEPTDEVVLVVPATDLDRDLATSWRWSRGERDRSSLPSGTRSRARRPARRSPHSSLTSGFRSFRSTPGPFGRLRPTAAQGSTSTKSRQPMPQASARRFATVGRFPTGPT